MDSDDRIRITDPTPEDPPKYGKVAAFFFLLAGVLLCVVLMPKKGWQLIAHSLRTIFASGKHVARPEGEKEIFED